MEGQATAPTAISVVNAIPAGRGAAMAIDRHLTATVHLDPESSMVTASTAEDRDLDLTLIEECVTATTERYGSGEGGHVETSTTVPHAVGLKTSSAAANATIVATLDALGVWSETDPMEALLLGVEVARAVGVTVTGALDDAAASMFGGLVITDNDDDAILDRQRVDGSVVISIPDSRQPSGSVDVAALEAVGPIGDLAADLAIDGRWELAMAVNGMAVGVALDHDLTPIEMALEHTPSVSISGTGPAIAAIGVPTVIEAITDRWQVDGSVVHAELTAEGTVPSTGDE